ncbi:MAG: type II toxin-antitoxin system VapC family toxin [Candidatus Bathyarchaeota archaeon]|nr:type II toxin-antitoxin system VapC family toxin [Candidatus Bathyarchaeota archaeon]
MAEGKVRNALSPHKLVGVDTMAFIYHLEGDERYEPFTRTLFKSIEEGECHAVTSIITLLEILVKPKMLGDSAMRDDYHYSLTSFPNLKLRPVDEEVAEAAATIRAMSGLRTPDALQVATCVVEGASAFITNDVWLKKINEPKIIVMSEILG